MLFYAIVDQHLLELRLRLKSREVLVVVSIFVMRGSTAVAFIAYYASLLASATGAPVARGMTAGFVAKNVTTGSCSYSATCGVSGIEGVCVSVSTGCCSGTVTSGLCPGSDDIRCCTNNPCSTPSGSGTCMQTSICNGTPVAGYCDGPSDLQCCVGGTPGPIPVPDATNLGIDVSTTMTASSASCLVNSYSYIIPRGFMSTGYIDNSVCTTLTSAMNAGFKTRDAYIFPCNVICFIYSMC